MENFDQTFKRKLIYVFRINDDAHKGLLKIGEATVNSDIDEDKLFPNSSILNQSAKKRIDSYTKTACIEYDLIYTELAVRTKIKNGVTYKEAFRDHDVHRILINSGIQKMKVGEKTGKEWFKTDLATTKNAISAVKRNEYTLTPDKISSENNPVILRPEQKEAIEKTIKNFKTNDRMLWNAKMRFGKTLSALEVVKRMDFNKSIIVTHRPVVNKSWHDDFKTIFKDSNKYVYLDKTLQNDFDKYLKTGKSIIYFASVQDLRGSSEIGGKFDKNNKVFDMDWDCVIVDEAHEGTTTALGEDVIKALVKEDNNYKTRLLALSGTPFNILNDYNEESVYTWDYMMEQRAKLEWDINNFGDSNPYEELPKMKIFTYDLGNSLGIDTYEELEEKAFNFKEFFRTWTDKEISKKQSNARTGDFIHEQDIQKFLNLITKEDATNNYPYTNDKYRDLFKHSLWLLPGVKEAKALSSMLKAHKVFGSGQFEIINVAGDGDDDEISAEALKMVRDKIDSALKNDTYTITLSCGKLTTGVTVPEWTAVMMLAGSYSTSASNYLQTIFRVQSPANINGKRKEYCYVFDFAPDRTLKMVADAVQLSAKAGKTKEKDRVIMGEFLNFCPIISYQGTQMIRYDESKLLEQLKRAFADRAVKSGFDDSNLYNDELLKLSDIELQMFDNLKEIVGSTQQTSKISEIDINKQGFTDEEYEKLEKINKKKKNERTKKEEEFLKKRKEQLDQRRKAISILRAISIRIPLLIYGANIDFKENVNIEDLLNPDIVDDSSWNEFMPKGITREKFKECIKYYDIDVFNSAGRRIRNIVKNADTLVPTERVKKIAKLFSYFKNPDKETVLTPWRVVNMHISDCLGGYDFYDEKHENMVEEPRFINQGQVTSDTFANSNAQILEINSKTGLYPLFVAYSIFRNKCGSKINDLSYEEQQAIWNDVVQNAVFVICKTEMAKYITKRTLVGFNDVKINAHYFEDLINTMRNKSEQFVRRINNESYWKKGHNQMKFNAIIGNPPYQESTKGYGRQATAIYTYFVTSALKLMPDYVSMIIPARWFAGGMGTSSFREDFLNDEQVCKIVDYPNSQECFKGVDISGGVCYFLWKKDHKVLCDFTSIVNGNKINSLRKLNEYETFIRDIKGLNFIKKIKGLNINQGKTLDNIVSQQKPFGLPTNYQPKESGVPCWFIQKIGLKYANKKDIIDSNNYLNKWKFLVPKAPIAGQTDFTKPVGFYYDGNTRIAKPGEVCTESYIILGAFDTEEETLSYKSYIYTKTVRFLLLQTVVSQDVLRKKFCFIPALEKYTGVYTDERLQQMWNITEEEMQYIKSRIYDYNKQ